MPTTTFERLFTRALIALLAFVLLFLCGGTGAGAEAPCTHYSSPSGSGNACTEAQPCLVGTWLGTPAMAAPGAVLCLTNGLYRGEQSMLTLTSVSGTEGHPITIRAMHDGQVTIDGQFGGRPLDCAGNWLTVQGVNIRDGNDTVLAIRGTHCTIQRVVAWSTQSWDGIENVVDIGGSHNLLEDCGAFGYARKTLAMGARGGTGPNTVRRCWVEHNGSLPGSAGGNPTNPMELGYDQDNGTFENVIARRNILSSATDPMPPLMMFSTRGGAILGSLAYTLPTDWFDQSVLALAIPEWGSHMGVGHETQNSLIQDLVVYAAPAQAHVTGFSFTGSLGTGNRADRIVAVAPMGGGACSGTSWSCTNVHAGTTVEQALAGKPLWELVPGVCYEYKDRILTATPLWPWKMAARIESALASARQPVRNVTRSVTQVLGTIPSKCMRNGEPVPPDPGPTPPTSHPSMACSGDLLTGGKITMQCLPDTNR